MKTDIQIKADLYTAITSNTTITNLVSNRVYWFNQQQNDYPMISYSMLDIASEYVLGGCVILSNEYIDVQVDVWGKFKDMQAVSTIVDQLKISLNAIGFMMIPGNTEVLDGDVIQRVTRWRYLNV
jgi:uncharacterized protein (DUF1015 family)